MFYLAMFVQELFLEKMWKTAEKRGIKQKSGDDLEPDLPETQNENLKCSQTEMEKKIFCVSKTKCCLECINEKEKMKCNRS